MEDTLQPSALLPLQPATFHILLAVAAREMHGYAVIQDVAARTDGQLKLSAGTLYRSIQRMLEQGLIAESARASSPGTGRRAAAVLPDYPIWC